MKNKFNKSYYFGKVYESYDAFMDYRKVAQGLANCYKFQSFLDIGCGCGNLVKAMKKMLEKKYKKECDVYGIDFSEFAVCKANVPYVKLADCTKKLPFKTQQFDLVHIYTTYSYLKNVEAIKKTMAEAYRVARKIIIFEDVFSQKTASNKDNYDPCRLRVWNKRRWLNLWQEFLGTNDKVRFTKYKVIIFKQ